MKPGNDPRLIPHLQTSPTHLPAASCQLPSPQRFPGFTPSPLGKIETLPTWTSRSMPQGFRKPRQEFVRTRTVLRAAQNRSTDSDAPVPESIGSEASPQGAVFPWIESQVHRPHSPRCPTPPVLGKQQRPGSGCPPAEYRSTESLPAKNQPNPSTGPRTANPIADWS